MEDDMLSDFFVEAEELFAEAEDSLLNVEKDGDYSSNFNSIFRAFHSVKGAAGMFGLTKLQEHMHYLENLLEKKKEATSMSAALIDYLLSGVDTAKTILSDRDCVVDFKYYDPDQSESDVEVVGKEDSNIIDKSLKEDIKKAMEFRKRKELSAGLVFVVDDEVDILEMTKMHLEDLNYTVETFDRASKALDALKTQSPDIVVSDISMPEMNGIQLMQEINIMKPHLPVIIVSGFVTKEVCIDTLACGVSGILEKPYNLDSFNTMIAINIDRYRAFKLLNKSVDLLVYQFEDFDKYFAEKGDEAKRTSFRSELKNLLKQKKILLDKVRA